MANELFRFMMIDEISTPIIKERIKDPAPEVEEVAKEHHTINVSPRDIGENTNVIMSFEGTLIEASLPRAVLNRQLTSPATSEEGQGSPGLVRMLGVGKAFVTRETLLGYVKEEFAFIENVLRGEEKVRSHRRNDKTELIESSSSSIETSQERDLQTHHAAELAKESSEQVSKEASLQAGVTVSSDYGTTKVKANASGSASVSSQVSNKNASRFSRSIVEKAVNKLTEATTQTKVVKSTTEIEELSSHGFKNTHPDAQNIAGVYRSLLRHIKVEVFEIGQRLILEFVVPQPAASLLRKRLASPDMVQPEPISMKLNEVLNDQRSLSRWKTQYAIEANKVSATDVPPPPKPIQTASSTFIMKPEDGAATSREPILLSADSGELSIDVPDGYRAKSAQVTVLFPDIDESSGGDNDKRYNVWVNVGHTRVALTNKRDFIDNNGNRTVVERHQQFFVDGLEVPPAFDSNENPIAPGIDQKIRILDADQIGPFSGEVPIAASAFSKYGVSITVSIEFEPMPDLIRQWAIESYAEIQEAYNERVAEYQSELDRIELDEDDRPRVNSHQNRETEQRELKRACLSLLMQNARLDDPDSSTMVTETGDINFDAAGMLSSFATRVKSFESAFEWENMTYLFYPYFWADRENWLEIRSASSLDSTFESFLTAGAARVFVPVRPGYSEVVAQEILVEGSFDNFSVEEKRSLREILELDKDDDEEVLVDCFEKNVPTNLVILDDHNPQLSDLLNTRQGCIPRDDEDDGPTVIDTRGDGGGKPRKKEKNKAEKS